jgi:hypothetical protein
LLQFPRVVEAPADANLPSLFLTQEELGELKQLLNVQVLA